MTTLRNKTLRQKLDKMGYKMPLSLESTPLVDKLLKDIIRLTERSKSPKRKDLLDSKKQMDMLRLENFHLLEENDRLYQNQHKKLERTCNPSPSVESCNQTRSIEKENAALKLLNNQYLFKIQELEANLCDVTKRLTFLQDKSNQTSIHVKPDSRSENKKRHAFVHQKMEIESTLPQARYSKSSLSAPVPAPDDPYVADMLTLSNKQIEKLSEELGEAKNCIENQNRESVNLKRKIQMQESEMESLNRQILLRCQQNPVSSPDANLSHLWNQVENLEKSRDELQTDLRRLLDELRETKAKNQQLTFHNKELQQELFRFVKDNDCVKETRQRPDNNLADENHMRELGRLSKLLVDRENEVHELKCEKKLLKNHVNELLIKERLLLDELSSFRGTSKKGKKIQQSNDVQLLQLQLNYYKRRVEELSKNAPACDHGKSIYHKDCISKKPLRRTALSASHPTVFQRDKPVKPAIKRRALTPPPRLSQGHNRRNVKSCSPDRERCITFTHNETFPYQRKKLAKKTEVSEERYRLIEDDRDYYKKMYENLRTEYVQLKALEERQSAGKECHHVFQDVITEKNKLQLACSRQKETIKQLQKTNDDLVEENSKIHNLYHQAEKGKRLMHQQSFVENSYVERSMVRNMERENQQLSHDYRNIIIERDALRDKLQIATETQLSERKRFENHNKLLDKKLEEKEHEFYSVCSERNDYKKQVHQLEIEVQRIQNDLMNANGEIKHYQALADQIRKAAEETQLRLEESEHRLAVKEASGIEDYMKKMEREIDELNRANIQQKNEIEILRRTVATIDREKDQIQSEVDLKSEQMASIKSTLKQKEKVLTDQKMTICTLESNLKRQDEDLKQKESDINELENRLQTAERKLQSDAFSQESQQHQIQLLKDDQATMTRENQRLTFDLNKANAEVDRLRQTIQGYVNEIARIEGILRHKEEERVTLLNQFRNMTQEASSLESQNSQLETETAGIRLELHAKNVEIQHLQKVLINLQQEVEQYIGAQHNLELELTKTRKTMKAVEEDSERYCQERNQLKEDKEAFKTLLLNLETNNEQLTNQLNDKERRCNEMLDHIGVLESQLACLQDETEKQQAKVSGMEDIIADNRNKEFQVHMTLQELTEEMKNSQRQLQEAENHLIAANEEAATSRARIVQLEMEVEQLQHNLTNEKFEREKIHQDLKRLKRSQSQSEEEQQRIYRGHRSLSPIVVDTQHHGQHYSTYRYSRSPTDDRYRDPKDYT